ncbi:CueP family metal-binding protein [Ornithinimicrobium sufpigmenti]|uniref:CueP family metal-binding protein n=1 Tax=Ornithinimicrobium sufpigmenti TaxID=2508882 RepID=UPI0010369B50|nr:MULTISPECIES: CueP family metal-binding protein [unclassified Ornithinimicrobium]
MTLRSAALLAALAVAIAGCSSADGGAPTSGTPGAAAQDTATVGSVPAPEPDTSADEPLPQEVAAMLEGYGVDPQAGVRAAITTLDRVDEQRPLSVQASVRTDDVVFGDGEEEITVPIPGDLVYVSIAPYVDQTHPCHFHALGGCQGEMVDEEVHVHIVDHLGEVLVDEQVTTRANGFVGYWLPKDAHGTVTITQGELTGVAAFETGEGDPTCVTSLQLRA